MESNKQSFSSRLIPPTDARKSLTMSSPEVDDRSEGSRSSETK
ncbi:hypothetical protein GE061_020123, partial [Apolygus lucorum]